MGQLVGRLLVHTLELDAVYLEIVQSDQTVVSADSACPREEQGARTWISLQRVHVGVAGNIDRDVVRQESLAQLELVGRGCSSPEENTQR